MKVSRGAAAERHLAVCLLVPVALEPAAITAAGGCQISRGRTKRRTPTHRQSRCHVQIDCMTLLPEITSHGLIRETNTRTHVHLLLNFSNHSIYNLIACHPPQATSIVLHFIILPPPPPPFRFSFPLFCGKENNTTVKLLSRQTYRQLRPPQHPHTHMQLLQITRSLIIMAQELGCSLAEKTAGLSADTKEWVVCY